ncbi:MAG: hypothetical protein Q8P48_10680, partial [Deltaproteobacteria bacterium]|nr:hypothetical protein [Deltaproteobacteria bacterium]
EVMVFPAAFYQAAEKVHPHRWHQSSSLRRRRKLRLIPRSPVWIGASHLELFEQPERSYGFSAAFYQAAAEKVHPPDCRKS